MTITPDKVRELLQRNSVTGDWRLKDDWLVSEWNAPKTRGRIPLAHVYHCGELMAAAPDIAQAYLEATDKLARAGDILQRMAAQKEYDQQLTEWLGEEPVTNP